MPSSYQTVYAHEISEVVEVILKCHGNFCMPQHYPKVAATYEN